MIRRCGHQELWRRDWRDGILGLVRDGRGNGRQSEGLGGRVKIGRKRRVDGMAERPGGETAGVEQERRGREREASAAGGGGEQDDLERSRTGRVGEEEGESAGTASKTRRGASCGSGREGEGNGGDGLEPHFGDVNGTSLLSLDRAFYL